MGFRAQIRELLSKETTALVPVTERNLQRFDATLTELSAASKEAGLLNINGQPEESNEQWLHGTKGLWLFGAKEADFSNPEQAVGFVNVYEPEHMDKINTMLAARHKRPYDNGQVLEYASFVKDESVHANEHMSATKQALARVFMDEQYKDVRVVSVWVTHTDSNVIDPKEEQELRSLGALKLDAMKYTPDERVDSTCFIIPRKAFLDSLLVSQI